jgi:hypothetical protein
MVKLALLKYKMRLGYEQTLLTLNEKLKPDYSNPVFITTSFF